MQTRPKTPASGGADGDEAQARLIRRLLIGGAILLVAVFGFMLWKAMQKESQQERWDTLAALREKYEPEGSSDPILSPPYEGINPERKQFIEVLENFLDLEASKAEGPLEPQTRYLIAKTIADHLLANPDLLDQGDRSAFYEKATKQLEAIHADHPDFPLNWTMLSQDAQGFPSLTRRFIQWLKDNQAWEKEHMLAPRAPDAGVRVLIRTERGDMMLGLYKDLAPEWTARFVERAAAGHYDGTLFVSRRKSGDAAEPGEYAIRAAGEASRDLPTFDSAAHLEAAGKESRSGELPAESRNRIPFDAGIVAAWHESTDEYDHDEQFLVVTARSPVFDYKYTPIGKLVDESGIRSLDTAERIHAGLTWREDKDVADDTEKLTILDWFQAPVKIVKILVYDEGELREPAQAAATRAAVEASEKSLATVKADAYKVEPPAPPAKKDEAGKDEAGKDEAAKDEAAKDEDVKKDGEGDK